MDKTRLIDASALTRKIADLYSMKDKNYITFNDIFEIIVESTVACCGSCEHCKADDLKKAKFKCSNPELEPETEYVDITELCEFWKPTTLTVE